MRVLYNPAVEWSKYPTYCSLLLITFPELCLCAAHVYIIQTFCNLTPVHTVLTKISLKVSTLIHPEQGLQSDFRRLYYFPCGKWSVITLGQLQLWSLYYYPRSGQFILMSKYVQLRASVIQRDNKEKAIFQPLSHYRNTHIRAHTKANGGTILINA